MINGERLNRYEAVVGDEMVGEMIGFGTIVNAFMN
jgi:hypothetical protein